MSVGKVPGKMVLTRIFSLNRHQFGMFVLEAHGASRPASIVARCTAISLVISIRSFSNKGATCSLFNVSWLRFEKNKHYVLLLTLETPYVRVDMGLMV